MPFAMDILDHAHELEQLHLRNAITAARQRAHVTTPSGDGLCEWCEEPAREGRWCSAECARDHEHQLHIQAKQRRAG